jgi:hypothetical protein
MNRREFMQAMAFSLVACQAMGSEGQVWSKVLYQPLTRNLPASHFRSTAFRGLRHALCMTATHALLDGTLGVVTMEQVGNIKFEF